MCIRDRFFPIEEDDRGTCIMNAKDLNMLAHLQALADAGVDSIKIEGRNKKAFYVATVVGAYRPVSYTHLDVYKRQVYRIA